MPTALAVTLALLLFVLVPLPALIAMARPKAAVVAVPFYLALFFALSIYHVGLWSGESVAMPVPAADGGGTAAGPGAPPAHLCEQALSESDRVGLIINRASRPQVVVRGSLWAQLPQQVKDGLVACLDATRPAGAESGPVEIVER